MSIQDTDKVTRLKELKSMKEGTKTDAEKKEFTALLKETGEWDETLKNDPKMDKYEVEAARKQAIKAMIAPLKADEDESSNQSEGKSEELRSQLKDFALRGHTKTIEEAELMTQSFLSRDPEQSMGPY